MDVEVLLQDVRDQLWEPNSSYLTNAMLMRWLNQAQIIIARKTKCLKRMTTFETEINQSGGIISDCMGIDALFYYQTANYPWKLTGINWSKAGELGLMTQFPGDPTHYVDWPQGTSRVYYLLPAPSAAGRIITAAYFAVPATMVCAFNTDGTPKDDAANVDPEIPIEYHDTLVVWCRYKKLAREEDQMASVPRNEFYQDLVDIRDTETMKDSNADNEFLMDYGW